MRSDTENPGGNVLPPDCPEDSLVTAIIESGYPLQGRVASKLKDLFHVTEEWGYFDSSTQLHRSLDIFAYRPLVDDASAVLKPGCALLVECKRSKQPYVFFRLVTDRAIPSFPSIAGVRRVSLYDRSGTRSREYTASEVLGLTRLPFIEPGPQRCATFSKAVRKGKVELSGVDPFNSIVLPMVRALDHALELYAPPTHAAGTSPTLIALVGVLDAPMVLVEGPDKTSDPVLTPWVRVVRQEANLVEGRRVQPFRFYAVDLVHIDYFDTFIHDHLIPFSTTFAERAIGRAGVLSHGGQVANLDDWGWDQIHRKASR